MFFDNLVMILYYIPTYQMTLNNSFLLHLIQNQINLNYLGFLTVMSLPYDCRYSQNAYSI